MSKMSAEALKHNLTNPAKTYLWEVLFANPLGGDTETLLIRCQSTSIPGVSVGSIHVPYKQTAGVKFPGKKTFSHTWTATFIEGEDREIFDAIFDWAQSIIDVETGLGALSFKRDVYLNLLNTDGSSAMKIKLVGCYPEANDDVAVSYDSEGNIMYPVTFSYDYWVKE